LGSLRRGKLESCARCAVAQHGLDAGGASWAGRSGCCSGVPAV